MSPETPTAVTKLCPTCGTRLSENATRCLVCGSELKSTAETKRSKKSAVQASRMPEITLSLPAALGFLALFLLVGATVLFLALRSTGRVIQPTPVATATLTPTITLIPTETLIPTDMPTATPLTPFTYTVKEGETCTHIALAFDVSVQSIIILNKLNATCTDLRANQEVMVPYPTTTVTPPATATYEPAEATRAACQKVNYTVQENDTLSSISLNYAVSMEAIKNFNGLSSDVAQLHMVLVIPLCERAATPGPTPTPTIPPPYPAANLLLPADGAAFTLANDIVTLQWASVGVLRENEAYQVTVEDVTEGQGRRIVQYVTDTKIIIPTSFRPKDNISHVMRWWVATVRQTGSDEQGQPIWGTAGAISLQRVFSWQGVATEGTVAP